MTITRFKCPGCNKDFRASPDMRLGPGQAQCGKCGCVFNTGLKNWNEYSAGGKLLLAVKELLDPLVSHGPVDWFYNLMMTLIVFGGLAFGVGYLLRPRNSGEEFFVIMFFVIYFGLYGIRLIRRIVICKEFAQTGKPPVWG